jgi:hypothetical protein
MFDTIGAFKKQFTRVEGGYLVYRLGRSAESSSATRSMSTSSGGGSELLDDQAAGRP